eukprot:CCRYP_010966-RC/>CCRYP_010966-RC protein AED:0.09 eAED:0.09 QI:59/0.92/0.86/1/0.85/0.8/15/815/1501
MPTHTHLTFDAISLVFCYGNDGYSLRTQELSATPYAQPDLYGRRERMQRRRPSLEVQTSQVRESLTMPYKFRRKTPLMPSSDTATLLTLVLFLVALPQICAQESNPNNNFCGASWDDASSNCAERQHCPSGTDDECETDGHICYGGTLCDASKGDGSKFAFANVPYDDISNTRFCGAAWSDALEGCSVETHCPSGFNDDCPDGLSCYGGLGCNIKDLMAELEESEAANAAAANKIGRDDPRRNQFCGISWGDASQSCSQWCVILSKHCLKRSHLLAPFKVSSFHLKARKKTDLLHSALMTLTVVLTTNNTIAYPDDSTTKRKRPTLYVMERSTTVISTYMKIYQLCRCPDADDSKCPGGQTCFGDTTCYYSEDLVPTLTPTEPQTLSPTTRAPSAYKDPANNRFCGINWGVAVAGCSIETSCPSGSDDDCPKGETCHGGTTCNLIDLLVKAELADAPTLKPTMPPRDDVSNSQFCGDSWDLADQSCSLATHCPDGNCPDGKTCYGGTRCNAYDMTNSPTTSPTVSPTAGPTQKPTGPTQSPTNGPPTTEAPVIPPTVSPTITSKPTEHPVEFIPEDDMRHSYWCGVDWNDVVTNCPQPCTSGQDTECPDGQTCFAFTTCRPSPKPASSSASNSTESNPTMAPALVSDAANATNTTPFDDESIRPTSNPTDDPIEFDVGNVTLTPSTIFNSTDTEEKVEKGNTESPIVAQQTGSPNIWEETMSPVSSPFDPGMNMTESPSTPLSTPLVWFEIETESPSPPPSSTQHVSQFFEFHTGSPSLHPSIEYITKATTIPTSSPSARPIEEVKMDTVPPPGPELVSKVGSVLRASKHDITNDVLLYIDSKSGAESPTKMYQYDGFLNALSIYSKGLMGSSYFYFGDNTLSSANYGLVNVALFLANAAVETVKYDICDEISWEKDVFGYYPISNACGQGGFGGGSSSVPYTEANKCTEEDAHMACQVDPAMETVAMTVGAWAGAPPPLQCFPKTSAQLVTGAWNPLLDCEEDGCHFYDGHVQGNIDPYSTPASNSFGRTDVEGCCWWGRGAFPRGSSGTCKIGKLNYFLGMKSTQARYEVDFCHDPEAVCRGSSDDEVKNAEVRWLQGLQYWVDDVQPYNENSWSYIDKIHAFVDGGLTDDAIFDAISTIITRGCHNCGKPISNVERRAKFDKIVSIFGTVQANGGTLLPSTTAPTTDIVIPSNPPSLRPSMRLKAKETYSPTATVFDPSISTVSGAPIITSASTPVSAAPVSTKTNAATSNTLVTTTSSPPTAESTLSSTELANRVNFSNSYCASSLQDAKDNCATSLKTCNPDDPPCAIGTACFGNVICFLPGAAIRHEPSASPSEDTHSLSPIPTDSPSSAVPPELSTISCGQICLRPLKKEECVGAEVSLAEFPDCLGIEIGEMCQTHGECGPIAFLNNCDGISVFVRVFPHQCSPTADVVLLDGPPQSSHPAAPYSSPSSNPTVSPEPPSTIISLNEINTSPTQHSYQNYGDYESAWWRDEVVS